MWPGQPLVEVDSSPVGCPLDCYTSRARKVPGLAWFLYSVIAGVWSHLCFSCYTFILLYVQR
ncbi:hypothetical protein BDZ91DRAFT_304300 [Kalaharituber pfeilii]|nr:hypothetical protein BDZ91DRAFT_304300 [Kalaharituber pfeilii]